MPSTPPAATAGSPAATAAGGSPRAEVLGPAVLLAAVLLLVYWLALGGELVYDDLRLIARNPRIVGNEALLASLGSSYWGFDDPATEGLIGYWRPLTLVALRAGYLLGGGEPWGFHALSLALHFAGALAAWRLGTRLLGDRRLAYLAALLFALHPVHVESVAWISALNDPLSGFLSLMALGSFVGWRRGGSRAFPWAASGWWLLALLAKEQALAVVPMALALDLGLALGGGRGEDRLDRRQLARGYLPFAAVFVAYWGARVLVFGDLLAGFDRANTFFGMGFLRGLSYRIELLGGFLVLAFVPLELELFRPFRPVLPPLDPAFWLALLACIAWAAGLAFAWVKRERLAFALLLFLPASLAPVLLDPGAAGSFPLSDRYLYAGSAAVALLLVHLVARRAPRPALVGLVAVLAVAFGARSFTRTRVWQDEERLFRAAVAESPRSPFVHWGLGRVLLQEYRQSQEPRHVYEAMLHFATSLGLGVDYGPHAPKLPETAPVEERALERMRILNEAPLEDLRRDPTVWVTPDDRLQAELGRGWAYMGLAEIHGEYDLDIPLAVFEGVTRKFGDRAEPWAALAACRLARGEVDEALEAFERALKINPAYFEAWHGKGRALVARGDWDGARGAFQRALHFRPGHGPTQLEIAKTAIEGRRYPLAEEMLAAAEGSLGRSTQADYWRGMLRAHQRDFSAALASFDRVLALQPDHGLAWLQKAKCLMKQGATGEAIRSFGRACELLPENLEAYYALGRLLSDGGQHDAAFPYLMRAYELATEPPYRADLLARLLPLVESDLQATRHLADVAQVRGDWGHALEWLHQALLIDPSWPDGHQRRGIALQRLGRFDEAITAYELALDRAPEHFWALHDLGLLLAVTLERPDAGRPHLEQALALVETSEQVQPQMRAVVRRNLENVLEKGVPMEPLPVDKPR